MCFQLFQNIPDRCYFSRHGLLCGLIYPIGVIFWGEVVSLQDEVTSSKEIGLMIKKRRKSVKVTQRALAAASGCGLKFIIELEQGKPTCQLQKVMTVLGMLGLRIIIKER